VSVCVCAGATNTGNICELPLRVKKERFECLLERARVRWERDAKWM